MNNYTTGDLNYWYDAQLRRFSLQVTRIFTNLHYATGFTEDGKPILRRVPVRYAVTDRQVAHILRNVSENVMFSVPMITVYLSNISLARDRIQEPFHVDKLKVYERNWDEEKGYGEDLGGRYILERYMPVPYNLSYVVDIWTSNQLQKDQLVEQILVLFNPGLQIQFSENVFDWTSLTEINLVNITWSSRGVNIGTRDDIEITSFEFEMPVWITPPAILEKQKLINTIITNIVDDENFIKESVCRGDEIFYGKNDIMARVVTTPGNHHLLVNGNNLILLGENGREVDENGNPFSWSDLINSHGSYRPGVSSILLLISDDIENWDEAVNGQIEFTDKPNVLLWSPDPLSLPVNNLPPVNAVIDPERIYPGNGLPVPTPGTRYIITSDIRISSAWPINATEGSIIEYDGVKWNVVFRNEYEQEYNKNKKYYLINSFDHKQLMWKSGEWLYSLDGEYLPGYWRLLL